MRKNFNGKNNPNWRGGKIDTKCAYCKTKLSIWPSRLKKKNYCSTRCSKIGKHPRTEFKKGHTPWHKGKKTGIIPWNKGTKGVVKAWNKGKKLGTSIFKGRTYEEIYGVKRALEIKKKIGKKSLGRKARLGIPFTVAQLRKVLSFRSPNKAELELNRILKTNFPKEWKFVGDGRVVIEGKNPDFINISGKKLLIELFGEYWHDESEVKPRKELFAKYGYKTLIIWSKELKIEKDVIKKVKELYAV